MQNFGDSVTITTYMGIPEADEDRDSDDESEGAAQKKRRTACKWYTIHQMRYIVPLRLDGWTYEAIFCDNSRCG